MNESIRVSIVSPFGTTDGGAEAWLLDIIDAGLNGSNRFTLSAVVMADGPLVSELSQRSASVAVLPTGASPAAIAARAPALARVLARQRPDVVISNGVKAQLLVSLANVLTRRPTIWVKHDHSFDRWLARPLASMCSAVISTAREVGEPTGRDDLVVIEPARPIDPLGRGEAKMRLAELGLGHARPLTLAMISRLVPYKGVDVAISALAMADGESWQLAVLGGDDAATPGESDRLAEIARAQAVADRVFFLGKVPGAGRLLTGVDALAVLTRPDGPRTPGREGFGIVATEAMLAGIPVIVAGPGPIANRLAGAGGPAGIVIPSADPELCARALSRMASEPIREAMGVRGRQIALQQPDSAQTARAVTDLVTRLAGRPGPAPSQDEDRP